MLFIIIGIVIISVFCVFGIYKDEFPLCLFLGFVVSFAIILGGNVIGLIPAHYDYDILPTEVYTLAEMQENQYYIFNGIKETPGYAETQRNQYYESMTEESKISVLLDTNDGFYKKQSFDENKVQFQKGEKAEISITKKKLNYDKMWLWNVMFKPEVEDEIESVIITVPKI